MRVQPAEIVVGKKLQAIKELVRFMLNVENARRTRCLKQRTGTRLGEQDTRHICGGAGDTGD